MQFADSHCHPHLAPLDRETDRVIADARANGVQYLLCVAVTLADAPRLIALARAHERVFASVGIHPNEPVSGALTEADLMGPASDPSVVAIGETGLDYYRSTGDLEWQRERFRIHIAAARTLGKPLIIHSREAPEDTIRIMEEEHASEVGGVMHCFTGTAEMARAALALGFYISFSGIVTFGNAKALRQVALDVPSDRLLIETDAPYLAPVPHRGRTNEPTLVRHVAETLSEVRQVPLAEIARQTTDNFRTLFRIST
ncbi:MAG: TatD family hydrolase [Acidiferrobacteraceae bacterium]